MSLTSDKQLNEYPLQVAENVWGFPANPDCRGGISWLLGGVSEPLLIDCPEVNSSTIDFLRERAGDKRGRILLTNREAHGRVKLLQSELNWPVVIQEQEAYLLPGIKEVTTFEEELTISSEITLLWTPGPTPGSCIAYAKAPFNVLFCGRLLIPVAVGELSAVKTRRTFHWLRQKRSLEKLRNWISSDPLPLLASGAALGLLGGARLFGWDAWKSP